MTTKKITLITVSSLFVIVFFLIMTIRLCISNSFSIEFRNGTTVIKQSPVSIYLVKKLCPNSYLKELFKSNGSINAGLLLVVGSDGGFSASVIMSKDFDKLMVVLTEEIETSPRINSTRASPK